MRTSRKKTLTVICLAITVLSFLFVTFLVIPCVGGTSLASRLYVWWSVREAEHRRVLLLSRVDHEALLRAGREVLRQIPKDYLTSSGFYAGKRVIGFRPLPNGIQEPDIIRDLSPGGTSVSYDGYLTLEMHGGMDHFGVRIYPEGFKAPDAYFIYGDRKLLEGLWYYDENYVYDKEYDKRIDIWIKQRSK